MIGYHGDAGLKARFSAHVERHRREDAVARGTYGETVSGQWRGCAVGCSLRSLDEIDGKPHRLEGYGNHAELSRRLGIPLTLAYLEDRIFEGLPKKEAMLWPTLFAKAIPVGADLSTVWPRFAHWLLVDPAAGVLRLARTDRARAGIDGVAVLFARQLTGGTVTLAEWREARSAAAADAYAAAYAAAAAADARSRHFRTMAEALLRFMSEAPVRP